MAYLLVDLGTGRVLSEHKTREQALDEVVGEITADGEQTVETLGLIWLGPGIERGSVRGQELLELAVATPLRKGADEPSDWCQACPPCPSWSISAREALPGPVFVLLGNLLYHACSQLRHRKGASAQSTYQGSDG